ncbi:MAG: hypothetical protein ACJA17_000878 [Polaribacter sp.]|jgi:hypothetical protein
MLKNSLLLVQITNKTKIMVLNRTVFFTVIMATNTGDGALFTVL